MSLVVPLIVLSAGLGAAPQTAPAAPKAPALLVACQPPATKVLTDAETAVLAGETSAAVAQLRRGADAHPGCALLALGALTLDAWHAAQEAGRVGGTAESLAATRRVIATVDASAHPGATPETYAAAVLHGAAAAAQDERDELRVWIEHARLTASRMALAGDRAVWPLSPDLAEGTLWMQVDDYEQAEAAFTAAVAVRESAVAWAGVARARDRRGNKKGACAAFRKVTALVPEAFRKGALATEARGYGLLCEP